MKQEMVITLFAAAALSSASAAECAATDRELMSDAYWAIWNDAEQSRIDADIEANRKADGTFDLAAPDTSLEQGVSWGCPRLALYMVAKI